MNLLAPFKAAGNFLGGLVRSRPAPDRDPYPVEEFPRDQEKMHGGPANIKLPAFLPYFDALQNVSETQVMRNAYRQMLSEPIVKAPTLTKIFAVASSELHLRPFGKKPNRKKGIAEEIKKYDRACEQAEFARWCLEDRLAGGVCGLVWSVLIHELMDGFSVSEKVWAREQRSPQYRSKWVLRAVKPKEVDNDLALVLDSYKNITGILGLRYNAGQTYDPRDFLISSHLPLFSTPTGMSDFRAAYGDYWFLDTCKKLRALGGEKRALPVVAGKYPDPTKQASVVAALKSLRNQNHIAVPKEVELQVLDIVGSADNYFKSWQADTQERIALAIAGATLQQMTGQAGAQRGDTKTHKDTADLRAWYLSQQICNLLNDAECGLLPDLIEPNFQEFDGFPRASMGGVDESELGESLKVDMGLQQMGFKHSTMAISDRYGREEAEDEDDDLAPAPKEPPGGKGGGGGLGGMLAGLGGKGPDEGGGGKEPAKGVGKPTEPTEPTEAEAFAEWDESQHPRVGGKFARKMAHKEASKHLNRVNHLWTQRAPFWSDETAHAAIHPHVNDASGSSWSGDADDMAFRREAVGKLRAALHKEIAAGHRPGQKAILERMLHHTEAAHAALQGKPAEMAEDETAAPEQDPEELAALIADVLGGLLGEDALKAFEEEADKHAEGTKRKWDATLHPRGKGGRFIPRGSAEAVSTAHSALGKLMGGDRHPEAIREALKHLSILTVKQLHDLKRQHGLKASGRLREELIQKIAERLPGHKPAAKEEAKPVETAPTPEPAPPTPTPAPSPGRADSLRSHLRAAAALQNKERLTPEDNQRLASLNAAIEGHEAALGPGEAQKVYDSLQMGHEGPEQRTQQETKPVQPVTQTPLTPTTPRQLTPEQEQEVERRTQELMGRARELAGPAGQTAAVPPTATGQEQKPGGGGKEPRFTDEPSPWNESHGGQQHIDATRLSAERTADLFGLPRKPVKFITTPDGKTTGDHGEDAASVYNAHSGQSIGKSINFPLDRDVTQGEHIAAHEIGHQAYSANSELGREVMEKLSRVNAKYGSSVSLYGAMSGRFENLMELAATYSHSPEALKRYSPEMYAIAQEWAERLRNETGKSSQPGNGASDSVRGADAGTGGDSSPRTESGGLAGVAVSRAVSEPPAGGASKRRVRGYGGTSEVADLTPPQSAPAAPAAKEQKPVPRKPHEWWAGLSQPERRAALEDAEPSGYLGPAHERNMGRSLNMMETAIADLVKEAHAEALKKYQHQPAPAAPAPTAHLDARIADAQRRVNELNAQLGPANQPPAVGAEAQRRNQLFRELQRAQGDLEHYTALRKQSAENPPNPPLTSQPGLTKIESVAKPEAEKKGPEGGKVREVKVKKTSRVDTTDVGDEEGVRVSRTDTTQRYYPGQWLDGGIVVGTGEDARGHVSYQVRDPLEWERLSAAADAAANRHTSDNASAEERKAATAEAARLRTEAEAARRREDPQYRARREGEEAAVAEKSARLAVNNGLSFPSDTAALTRRQMDDYRREAHRVLMDKPVAAQKNPGFNKAWMAAYSAVEDASNRKELHEAVSAWKSKLGEMMGGANAGK